MPTWPEVDENMLLLSVCTMVAVAIAIEWALARRRRSRFQSRVASGIEASMSRWTNRPVESVETVLTFNDRRGHVAKVTIGTDAYHPYSFVVKDGRELEARIASQISFAGWLFSTADAQTERRRAKSAAGQTGQHRARHSRTGTSDDARWEEESRKADASPSASPPETCWTILGVGEGSTLSEINQAYKRLSKIHHPDKSGGGEMMQKINVARDQARAIATASVR